MITIKHHKEGEIADYRAFPLSARGLSHAIYWLREFRSDSDPYLLLNHEPKSWIEIDGIRIPDSVLFQLSKEQHCGHFLKRFIQDHAKPVTQSQYKK
ncbi:MAG: hypothetical protein DU481_15175 [Nitrosomonas sp.]|uniref:hypothetical protein n=1 Tax=Nitrosomonas sp. TaxID=42353 RepID=UPI0032EBA988